MEGFTQQERIQRAQLTNIASQYVLAQQRTPALTPAEFGNEVKKVAMILRTEIKPWMDGK